MTDITRILEQIEDGDEHAAETLLPLVYDELRKLASARMAQEHPGHTLQATALVHEAYIRLVEDQGAQHWRNRGHFFGAAAEAMRRILVENARRKKRDRHGGQLQRTTLEGPCVGVDCPPDELLILNDTVDLLAQADPEAAELVKLRCFAGLSIEQAADVLEISVRTAYRDWSYARAWLFRKIGHDIRADAD